MESLYLGYLVYSGHLIPHLTNYLCPFHDASELLGFALMPGKQAFYSAIMDSCLTVV